MKALLNITLVFSYLSYIHAHAFMSTPIARRSRYSDYYVKNGLVDYDIMAPLNVNGYSYPCKGFPAGPAITEITTDVVPIKIESHGSHSGGHCQFGVSFDGRTFVVLKQLVRDCLKPDMFNYNYQITLPRSIPNGNMIVFWTWINSVGNREYYMDCADIKLNRINSNEGGGVNGKELIVANLPGYTIIPEFPNPNDYDGRELLLNAKDISINTPNYVAPTTRPTTVPVVVPTVPVVVVPTVPVVVPTVPVVVVPTVPVVVVPTVPVDVPTVPVVVPTAPVVVPTLPVVVPTLPVDVPTVPVPTSTYLRQNQTNIVNNGNAITFTNTPLLFCFLFLNFF